MQQTELFAPVLPPGMRYQEEFLSPSEERALIDLIATLPLEQAQYKQYTARRRTVNYGSSYDFSELAATPAPPIPSSLLPLRERVATWANEPADAFVHALVAEYAPGTPLGWHRDVPEFELIVGVSLASHARMRFRPWPWRPERRKEVFALELAPRSIYLLRDEARWAWQHSVPPVKTLRYSLTFRTARAKEIE